MAAGRGEQSEPGTAALAEAISKQALQLEAGGITELSTHLAHSHGRRKRNSSNSQQNPLPTSGG